MKSILFSAAILATNCLAPSLSARTWTEAATGRTIEGDFVRADGTHLTVRRADGVTVNLPLARLSEGDRAFVREQARSAPAAVQPSAPGAASGSPGGIIGTWEGYMANSDGSPHGEIRLVITDSAITATNPRGNQEMGTGRYTIAKGGGENGLRRIDAEGTSGQFAGRSYEGIFTIEGRTLKWCSANDNPRSSRPEKLQSDPPSGHFLMVLERKG